MKQFALASFAVLAARIDGGGSVTLDGVVITSKAELERKYAEKARLLDPDEIASYEESAKSSPAALSHPVVMDDVALKAEQDAHTETMALLEAERTEHALTKSERDELYDKLEGLPEDAQDAAAAIHAYQKRNAAQADLIELLTDEHGLKSLNTEKVTAVAKHLGIEVPEGASKADIVKLIAEHRAK